MLTWTLLAILVGLLFWVCRKPTGLPPGRWGLPLIGYIPLYTNNVIKIVGDLGSQYGDIFTWKVGSQVFVGLCDYKLIKETFNRPECQGRPYIYTFDILKYHSNTGFLNSVGDAWVQGRRFALHHLKNLGMGKSSIEGAIQHEALKLADIYEKKAGKPIEISGSLNIAVLNVIWQLVASHRYDINDDVIIKFNEIVRGNIDALQSRSLLLTLFPVLLKILPRVVLDKVFKINVIYENMEAFTTFNEKVIQTHLKNFDPDNPKDYIDAYLLEIKKERGNENTIFKDDYLNLLTSLRDFFSAGSETTSSTIRWFIALLANHPEIQEKVHKEIDAAVPRDQLPSLQDKEKLPYTEAVIYESMRYSTLVPHGVWHATTDDIKIGEYRIPKNTILFANARSCHRNPKYFERPDEFYPEHFLDKDGKALSKKEGFLPFSLGRRQCLGKSLATMELFLFLSCLLQRFKISPPKGGKVPLKTAAFQPILNFILPYEVVFTKRE